MNKIKSYFKNLSFSEKSIPVVLFILCTISFGLLIPKLGFYMDDWQYVFYANLKGVDSLAEMLTYDSRPGATWLYMSVFQILGVNRLAWHVLNFVLILLTAITYWMLIRFIWEHEGENLLYGAMLFLIYPFFMLHSSPIGYSHLWVGFIAFNLSMLFMCISLQKTGVGKWLFIFLSLGLEAIHLFTSEYFSGLELIRIVILWIFITRVELTFLKKIWWVLQEWALYFLLLVFFFYWRIGIYQNPEGIVRNEPVLLSLFLTNPLKALMWLINTFIADSISILTIGWQKAINPSLLNITSPYVQFKLFICALVFYLVYFYFSKFSAPNFKKNISGWQKHTFILALVAILAGGLPIWAIGRSIVESMNLFSASRFGLPATFGASLIILLIVNYFIDEKDKKNIFFAFCVALALNFHFDTKKEFQTSWEKQERFISQLLWRAPVIESGTAILTDQEVLGVMGEYAVSFSINTAYQVKDFGNTPPYWYFPFLYTNPNIESLLAGAPLEYSKLSMQFQGNSNQMLLLDFNPEMKRCLWILQPQDTNLRLVSEDVRKLAAGSDINLIKLSDKEVVPPEEIYGKQNSQTWCYFFQKADLARQYQEWDGIIKLWNESQSLGERPDNGFEYIPFIEGFGNTEDWGKVKELTKFANKITAGLEPSLCSALDRLAINAPESLERDETILSLKDDLSCTNY